MAQEYTQMTGKELISKILSGERDFRGIALPDNTHLSRHRNYEQLKNYLNETINENPLIFLNSRLINLQAPDLKMCRANFKGASLYQANFRKANLNNANFTGVDLYNANFKEASLYQANFREADLYNANFTGANLMESDLIGTDFRQANLNKAKLWATRVKGTNFEKTNLVGVLNLDKVHYLGFAIFKDTKVTEKEREIIEKARKEINLYNLVRE
jgi:uncharacterized protein YjbI with pentapeptide repeats